MTRLNLQSIPITSTPSLYFWSQAYSAGTVHLALSLEKSLDEEGTEDTLKELGKEIIDSFEAEYFTLMEKNLEGIEQSLQKALENIPQNVSVSAACCAIVEDILYILSRGGGKIQIQRDGEFGTLIQTNATDANISKGSGKLLSNDRILLGTRQFYDLAQEEDRKKAVSGSLEEGEELLKALTAIEQKGAASIIIFAGQLEQPEEAAKLEAQEEEEESVAQPIVAPNSGEPEEQNEEGKLFIQPLDQGAQEDLEDEEENFGAEDTDDDTPSTMSSQLSAVSSLFEKINFRRFVPSRIPRSKGVILFGIVLLALILIFGVITNIKKKEQAKLDDMFAQVFPQAQQKYDEGVSLESLNKNLARDDFQQAFNTLDSSKNKFPKDSDQEKKIEDLLTKVSSHLDSSSSAYKVSTSPVASGEDLLLDKTLSNKDITAINQDDKLVYFANNSGISSVDKKSKQEKQIIKKDWTQAQSLAPYLGNVYLLDPKDSQIYKFAASDSGFSKQNYLSSSTDLSKAVSIAIDGSVWVLQNDGTIIKFTRGKQDSYTIAGLDKNFSNPSQIWTNTDSDNYYVLDNGNSRIVEIGKDKGYISQFQSDLLKNAKYFDVFEKDKKILFTSGNKIYYFNLQ